MNTQQLIPNKNKVLKLLISNLDFGNASTIELQNLQDKLNFLCLEFDPFNQSMSAEIKQLIEDLDLMSFLENPFSFTNKMLQILDLLDNELKARSAK